MFHFHRPNCQGVLHYVRELIILIPLLALTMNFPAVAKSPERMAQETVTTQSIQQSREHMGKFVDQINELLGMRKQRPSA